MLTLPDKYVHYREGYRDAVEALIGSSIAMRDKAGMTWEQRMQAADNIKKVLPILIRCMMYLRNIEEPVV